MNFKQTKLIVFFLSILLIQTACKGSKKVAEAPAKEESGYLLQVNMEKGQTFKYKQDIKQVITQSIMGMNNEMNQNIGFGFEMSVEDVVEGRPKVKISYLSASYMMDNPMRRAK